jgi:Druantia protein DruA
MTARVALLRMHDDGLLTLPAPRNSNGNGRHPRHHLPSPELPLDLARGSAPTTLDGLGPLRLAVVDTPAASDQWRHLIAAHHYLGYSPFAGAQLRYLVHSGHGIVAALAFAASAWACAPRDAHIGWDPPTRKARLHLVVGNARFLIPPDLHVPNLASHVLARTCHRLPADWQAAYGYTPVLVETFVETGRFTAASYRAASWTHVGQTQGRGKLDRHHHKAVPVKDIYLYPLHRHYRRILTTPD